MFSISKIMPFATIVLVAFISNANAVGCFGSGITGDCSAFINGFCSNGRTIAGRTVFSQCFNMNNYHCDLKIENTAINSMTITADVCKADMLVTNNGCSGRGGVRQDSNFLLTIDPNAGSC